MKFLKKKPKKAPASIPQHVIVERRTNQVQAVIDYRINNPGPVTPERES
jgi:hypothetical protein